MGRADGLAREPLTGIRAPLFVGYPKFAESPVRAVPFTVRLFGRGVVDEALSWSSDVMCESNCVEKRVHIGIPNRSTMLRSRGAYCDRGDPDVAETVAALWAVGS